eukprot:gnl/Hemi2/6662_TR2275_c0_g2_i1.p1 gnl/Hemi2/6662_TR2275_c0_g2~~gnl/Hemi2/6662_TR2275_c0_g2_i1.p1  ORF type:complete len:164 (-),score=45.64 gnl/Hemi2/6662_TR2275_c0_g2_i1:119-610(-)
MGSLSSSAALVLLSVLLLGSWMAVASADNSNKCKTLTTNSCGDCVDMSGCIWCNTKASFSIPFFNFSQNLGGLCIEGGPFPPGTSSYGGVTFSCDDYYFETCSMSGLTLIWLAVALLAVVFIVLPVICCCCCCRRRVVVEKHAHYTIPYVNLADMSKPPPRYV